MYNQFFGFRESPFKLVPDPAYLFLGKTHEEALAFLRYAVTAGEGFVTITGEIGTGKTMLCRTFLEGLDESVESAYIFNPRMDGLDLLKAINDEFGISGNHDSTKALIDELNRFLMDRKASGRTVVLLIDEAQNLSRDVLEQVRLLSNLETTKEKLLNIILAGQPELEDMLNTRELRQLRQRIALSCRLAPLTRAETKAYIAHRVQVAAKKPLPVFSSGAMNRIYRFSGGIPRLINMACDRSLITAFGCHGLKVSAAIAKSAIRELSMHNSALHTGFRKMILAAGLAAVVIVSGWWAWNDGFSVLPFSALPPQGTESAGDAGQKVLRPVSETDAFAYSQQKTSRGVVSDQAVDQGILSEPEIQQPGVQHSEIQEPEIQEPEIQENDPVQSFSQILTAHGALFSRETAAGCLLNKWQPEETAMDSLSLLPGTAADAAFFSHAARSNGLNATPIDQGLKQMLRLNVPAVLIFRHPVAGSFQYLTVVRALRDALVLSAGDPCAPIRIPYDEIRKHWTGRAVVFWKDFYHYQKTLTLNAAGDPVITLKLHLREMGFQHISISGVYDLETRAAVQAIQARHGIPVDGLVGPLTKIVLYNETPALAVPHLWKAETIPDITGSPAKAGGGRDHQGSF